MASKGKSKDKDTTSQPSSSGSSTWSKRTFAASMVFIVVLAVCFIYVAGPNLWNRGLRSKPAASSAPASAAPSATAETTSQVEAGSSVCGLAPGSQNLPSGPFEQRMIPVSTTWGVPEVKDVGPGITTGITRCFAHSPSGAVVGAVNFMRWFSSQDRLPDVVRALMVDDSNRSRMLNQIEAGWDGQTTQPVTIRGYRAEVRGPNEILVTLLVSRSATDDRMVSWQLVMVWEGGDWKVQAPNSDSWGQELVDSPAGYSAWTVK